MTVHLFIADLCKTTQRKKGSKEGDWTLQFCHRAAGKCYSSAAPSTGQGSVKVLAKMERSRLGLGEIKPKRYS